MRNSFPVLVHELEFIKKYFVLADLFLLEDGLLNNLDDEDRNKTNLI